MLKPIKKFMIYAVVFSLVFSIMVPITGLTVSAAPGTVITIAYPGDGADAGPAIKTAIAQAKNTSGPVTIEFVAGKEYHVWPETSYFNTGYYVSNSASNNGRENPNGDRWSAIFLQDMEDVTIEGNDSLLLVHGVLTTLFVDNSRNIAFQNLNIDYAVPTTSEITIVEKTGTSTIVEVNKSSLYEIRNNQLIFLGEDKLDGSGRYWEHSGKSPIAPVVEYNPDNQTCWRSGNPLSGVTQMTDLGNNKIEMIGAAGTVGRTYQYRDGVRNQVGSFIHMSKDVSFTDMGFHYMHGLGIVGQYSENLTFSGMDCTPRPETGRTNASFADFIQISGCKGLIKIENSEFFGAHDDIINIHGTHLIVTSQASANKIEVDFRHHQSWGFQAFNPGDDIEFIDVNSLLMLSENKVVSFERLSNTRIALTLEQPLAENMTGKAVENVSYTPDVHINNIVGTAIPTRGILCTTRGNVLIENSTFNNMQMADILLEDDARGWYESGMVKNMTIRNNIFNHTGGGNYTVFHSNPQTNVRDPEKTVHSNITIEGNTFIGRTQLVAQSTKNVIIKDNIFQDGGNVRLEHCDGFAVQNNTGLTNTSTSNCINEQTLAAISASVEGINPTKVPIERAGWTGTANFRPANPTSNAFDGNTGTIWHTDWDDVLTEIDMVIDLGEDTTFDSLGYLPRQSQENGMFKSYELYTSTSASGDDWGTAIATGNWQVNPSLKEAEFSEVTARRIKLVATDVVKDSQNRLMGSAAEIYLYKTDPGAPLSIGKRTKVNVTGYGESGATTSLEDAVITYESSDESILITGDGWVSGVATGTADVTITVTKYGTTLSETITVIVGSEEYDAITALGITVPMGIKPAPLIMEAEIDPITAIGDLRWSTKTLSKAGNISAITQEGVLSVTNQGRFEVAASSYNDDSINDSVRFTAMPTTDTPDWQWIRENADKWQIEDNKLKVNLENGNLWAGANSVKNILLLPVEEDDWEAVVKLDYIPTSDYAEAGIICYVDDDNYAVLTRKKHSGYGGNIFSLVTENSPSPWESPALPGDRVMDTEGSILYLKLTKSGDNYSGYYSADNIVWTPIYENRVVALEGAQRIGTFGASPNVSNQHVIYESLKINDSLYNFGTLESGYSIEKSKVTSVEALAPIATAIGTTFEELALPSSGEITWNQQYVEQMEITWDSSQYNSNTNDAQTLTATILSTDDKDNPDDLKIEVVVTLTGAAVASAVPNITSQPSDKTVEVGGTAQLSLEAQSPDSGVLSYQWQQKDSAGWLDIPGATSSDYTTEVLGLADNNRQFLCVVTNQKDALLPASVNSSTVTITVFEPDEESKNILSVSSIAPIPVDFGTEFQSLSLPTQVDVMLENGDSIAVSLSWVKGSYNGNLAGTYTLVGTIEIVGASEVTNTNNLAASIAVTVRAEDEPAEESKNILSVGNIAPISVDFGTEFQSLSLPTQVDVTLENGASIAVSLSWVKGSYNENLAGDYTLVGTIELVGASEVTNTNNLTASIAVTVRAEDEPTPPVDPPVDPPVTPPVDPPVVDPPVTPPVDPPVVDPPVTPPTPPVTVVPPSGRRPSIGTSTPDRSPNLPKNKAVDSVLTVKDAKTSFDKTVSELSPEATQIVVKISGKTKVTGSVISELQKLATEKELPLQILLDTVENSKVVTRITISSPLTAQEIATTIALASAKTNTDKTIAEKYGDSAVVADFAQQTNFGGPVKIHIKLSAELLNKPLEFHRYNPTTKLYALEKIDYIVDANGYISFETNSAENLIICAKQL